MAVNIVVTGKHVVPVERTIRTVNKGTRYHVHRLPYNRYPKETVKSCSIKVIKNLNNLHAGDSTSNVLRVASLIAGRIAPD